MNPVDIIVNLVFTGFILVMVFVWGRMVQRWSVKVAVDDGMTIRYVGAEIIGRTVRQGRTFYVVKYRDMGREYETLVPDQPGYQRLMRFWMGLNKAMVFRVDANGNPLPWNADAPPVVDAAQLLHIKTHEMIINSLRTRIVLDKLLLYIVIIVVAVCVLAGIVVWRATSQEIVVQLVNQTTGVKPEIPGVGP